MLPHGSTHLDHDPDLSPVAALREHHIPQRPEFFPGGRGGLRQLPLLA